MYSNIIVELPWNTLMAVILFACYYWPIGMYRNAEAAGQFTERTGLMFLFIWSFLMFTSTFTDLCIAAIETAEGGGNVAQVLFSLCLIFCGVLATPDAMPRFWIFMYRVSPFTYLVDGMLSTGLANTLIECQARELLHFEPAGGLSCGEYLGSYMSAAGGYLVDENATNDCQFCSVKYTNVLLEQLGSNYSRRWRNWGLLQVYIVFNIFGALGLYWLARVPKNTGKEQAPTEEELELKRTRTGGTGIHKTTTKASVVAAPLQKVQTWLGRGEGHGNKEGVVSHAGQQDKEAAKEYGSEAVAT
jgi:ABC-type multidrug transport system permease subunit